MTVRVDSTVVRDAHQALLTNPGALRRLAELRGWTAEAVEDLGLGLDGDRILIPVVDAEGDLAALLRYQPNPDKRRDGQPKTLATPGSRRELFPAPENLPTDGDIWIVEGEPDAIAARSAGLHASGVPGTQGWRAEWAARFTDRHIVVCCDCDRVGRALAAKIADDLLNHATSVRLVDLAATRDDGYDIGDVVAHASPDDALAAGAMLAELAERAPAHVPADQRPPRPRVTPAQWRTAILDHLHGRTTVDPWPVPLPEISEAADGGIRPGEVWVLAGYSSRGKSVYADMLADTVAATGAHVHVYATEMTLVQRGLRYLARRTAIPYRELKRRDLLPGDMDRAEEAVRTLTYGCTPVEDWKPEQVVADIRAHAVNVAIIDLLHGFHYSDERELTAILNAFTAAASTDASGRRGGTALLLVCHLNDGQLRDSRSPAHPRPGMHSLKGASSIRQRADVVMFTHLHDDADGMPTTSGEVWMGKHRNGPLGQQHVRLDVDRLIFEPREES